MSVSTGPDPAAVGSAAVTVTGVPIRGSRPVRPAFVIALFCLGLFMTLLDISIVNIAIPELVTDLGAGLETVLWVGSAYSLVYTVLLITTARLGDIVGPRTMFVLGIAVFTAASLACGLAATSGQLIAFRALQGLGAAMLAPQGLAFISSILPPDRRGPAFAAVGIMSGLGVLLGPTLGGLLVSTAGWRWIFFLNVPVGIVVIALAVAFMPDVRPGRPHRLDLLGVALLTAGLLFVVFGLIEGERYDWGAIFGVVSVPHVIGLGGVLLGAFVWRQVRTQRREPLLPFDIFRDRTFSVMTVVLLVMGFAMVGIFLPLTIYYQSVLGLSAVAAGLVIGTQSMAMMVTSGVVGGLSGSGRIPLKWVLVGGLVLFAAGMTYVVAVAEPDSGQWAFVPGLVTAGIGLGCVWTPLFGLATRDLPPARAGIGAGVLDTVQEFGAVFATAALGALLASSLSDALLDAARSSASALPADLREAFVAGVTGAGSGGLHVGAGQAAAAVLAEGVPSGLAGRVHAAAQHAFAVAFTDAMGPTMIVPIVVVAGCAVLVAVLVRSGRTAPTVAPAADR